MHGICLLVKDVFPSEGQLTAQEGWTLTHVDIVSCTSIRLQLLAQACPHNIIILYMTSNICKIVRFQVTVLV